MVALCGHLGLSLAEVTGLVSTLLIASLISRLPCALLSDRFGAGRILIFCSAIQCATLTLLALSETYPAIFVVTVFLGLAQGGILPSYPLLVRAFAVPGRIGSAISAVPAGGAAGMVAGGWAGGWLFEQTGSYSLTLWSGVLLNLMNLAIIFTVRLWHSGMGSPAIVCNTFNITRFLRRQK